MIYYYKASNMKSIEDMSPECKLMAIAMRMQEVAEERYEKVMQNHT